MEFSRAWKAWGREDSLIMKAGLSMEGLIVRFEHMRESHFDDGMNVVIVQGVIHGFAFFAAAHQAGAFERFELVAYRGKRHAGHGGKITDA